MILTDTFIIERAELITEHRGGKSTQILRGVFGRCDEKNNNNRIYSKTLLSREVKRISEAMQERRLLGELDHPAHDAVKLSNVSHLITGLAFTGNELIGECELLDTPSGKVAQALIEGGVKVGISSRGMGTLSEQSDGTKTVNEDFKLVTFDLVADPSTRGAFPGVSESDQSHLVEEIVKDTLDKAAKEKVFTTLLKDKLREKMVFNQKPARVKSAKQLQKDASPKIEKPTVEEPFKNWDYFYGAYTGKPRLTKTRSYVDFDTVTAPAEVTENKYCILKNIIVEDSEDGTATLLLELLYEGIVRSQGKSFLTAKRRTRGTPGKVRQKIGALLKTGAEKASGRGLDYTGPAKGRRTIQWRTPGERYKQRYNPDTDRAGMASDQVEKARAKDTERRRGPVKVDAIPGEGVSDFKRGPRPKKRGPVKVDAIPGEGTSDFNRGPRPKKRGPVKVDAIPGEGTKDLDEPQKPRKKDNDRPIRGGTRKEVPATTPVDRALRDTRFRRRRGPTEPKEKRALRGRIRKSWLQDKEELGPLA